MLKRRFISLVQIVFLFGLFSTAEAVKPQPPLQLSLLQAPLSEKQSQLTLTATANIDSDQVRLSIDLPAGLSLVGGDDQWEGALKKGETKKIEAVVENPRRSAQRVTGMATLQLEEGGTFVQRSTLTLGEPTGRSSPSAPSIKRRQDGENILEFRGK